MASVGKDAAVIYNTFNLTENEKKSVSTIKKRFTEYFTPKINETYERYVFNTIVQKECQTFDEFVTDHGSKIKNCGYGTLEDTLIRDRIVVGIINDTTREKLLAEGKLTLQKAIDICHSAEQVKMQVTTMKQAATVDAVTWNKKQTKKDNKEPNKKDETFHCNRCDTTHGRRNCPAFKKICQKCKRKGHLTKCCKSKTVNELVEDREGDYYSFVVSTVGAELDSVDVEDWYEKATLAKNVMVKFKLDTGSQCNVLNYETIKNIDAHISPTSTKCLTSFSNHKIPVLGEVVIDTLIKKQEVPIKYLVVKADVSAVLGKSTCEKLKLVKRIETLTIDEDLFEGIGCLKQYIYDIDLIENPKLSICPARKIPHTIRQQVKEELDSMVAQKIIKPITKPTPAVSPMVVVRKNNKIRLCLDPSVINKNLKRRYYPLNTLEEITARIHGSNWFTLLDCKKGFWQLQVTPRTSEYLTFSTPFGRYSCLRMPFGLASAPEVFQQVMSSLIADVKNAEVSMDDVLLHATSKLELERITQEVLDKFKIAGLKLNKEKCVFNTQEVKFLGHIVSAEGVKLDPEKIETITKIKQPENVKELQRFLGMVTYVSKFIKNLADITQPLRQLLRKDVEWVWDTQHNEAFNKLKNLLKNPPVLGYYDTKAPILLSVDASSYACGGVLIQKQKPIAYCAKSFTKTEQDMYIWGCKDLTIESDHKPLKTIFKKPITDAPPRLQRIMYQILPYNPKVTYKKGTELYVADFLSRDCENLDGEDLNTENLQICAIVPFTKTRKDELKAETAKSKELNDLKLIILKGWPDTINKVPVNLKKYWYYREALSVYEDIIFKDHRVLVPNTMVPLVMKHCHLSHKGLQGTLKLARDNIFWPTMTKDLTEYIKTCGACSKIQKDNQMEQINLQAAPKRPWSIVASDIFHLRGKDCLLIADSYSGYFDFKQLNNITSFNVIKEFKTWFATFGIPEVLLSDGGKQFDCSEFRAFQKEWNFEHRISSPHFPRSNGLAERYVQEAKNLMKKCLEDNTDIHLALLHHRNTPRLDLGSPVQRLMNRRTRTLLPTNEKLLNPKIIKNVSKKLTKLKEGEKGTADRNKKQSREYTTQEKVLLRQSHNNWVPAYIVRPEGHRSYRVQTEDGATYRRNTWHLKPATSSLDVNPNSSTDRPTVEPKIQSPSSPTQPPTETTTQQCSPDDVPLEAEPSTPATPQDAASLNHPPRTRCGRVIKTPARYR
ncbi:PREDICTED: uncharacterized protein K02A2.6-like [Rhagoletis zephyria]|uniref:uncharacterized protein K02A2.6-like n=1 Tax=Rhagoletis zephyria TaxID=28612 RepID=UPI000811865A|nr:PREDICTED: uncharacterized protein K02A2.6-like [Rhagoletis zephyria]XP_017469227.1 PREDICTED: uncharacterized protein K02A2.6-like [Rhagoletis zephyria]